MKMLNCFSKKGKRYEVKITFFAEYVEGAAVAKQVHVNFKIV